MLTGSMIEKFAQRFQDLSNKVKSEDNYVTQYNLLEEENQNYHEKSNSQKESSKQKEGSNFEIGQSDQHSFEAQNQNFIQRFADKLKEPSKEKQALLQKIRNKIALIKPKAIDKKDDKQKNDAGQMQEKSTKKRGRPPSKYKDNINEKKKPENNSNSPSNQQNNDQNQSKQPTFKQQTQRRQAMSHVLNQIKSLTNQEKNNYLRNKYKQLGVPSTHELKILVDSYKILFAIEKQIQDLPEKPNEKQTSRRFARQFLRYVQQNKTDKKYKFRKICSIVLKGLKLVNFRPDIWLNKFMIQNRSALKGVDLTEYSQKNTSISKTRETRAQPSEKNLKQRSEPKEKLKNHIDLEAEEQYKQEKKGKKDKQPKTQNKKSKKGGKKKRGSSVSDVQKQKSDSFNEMQDQNESQSPVIRKKIKKGQQKRRQKQKQKLKNAANEKTQNEKQKQKLKQIDQQREMQIQIEKENQKSRQREKIIELQKGKEKEKEKDRPKQRFKLKQKSKQTENQKNRDKQQAKTELQFFQEEKQVKSSKPRKNTVEKSLKENKNLPSTGITQPNKNGIGSNKPPTIHTNKQVGGEISKVYPQNFRKKIAAKLDTAIYDIMQNLIKQKCQQFCVEQEALKQINKQFGKYLLERSLADDIQKFTSLYQYEDQLHLQNNIQVPSQKQFNIKQTNKPDKKIYNLNPLTQQLTDNIQMQDHSRNITQANTYTPQIIIKAQNKTANNKKPQPTNSNISSNPFPIENNGKQIIQKKPRDIYKPSDEDNIQQAKIKTINPFQVIGNRLMNFIRINPTCNERMIKDQAIKIVTTAPQVIGKVKQQALARWLHTFISRNKAIRAEKSPISGSSQQLNNSLNSQKPKIMIKPPISLVNSSGSSILAHNNYRPVSPINSQPKPQHNTMQNGTNGGYESRTFNGSLPRMGGRMDPKVYMSQNGRI